MRGGRSVFWAIGSAVVALVGSFGPWAREFGLTIDGSNDELIGIAALVAALALVAFSITRQRTLTAVPLVAGLVSTVLVGHDLVDPAGAFGGRGPTLEWGIWTALAGSLGLAIASLAILTETTGVTLERGRLVRAGMKAGRRSTAALRHEGREVRRLGPRTPVAMSLANVVEKETLRRDPHRDRMKEFWSLARSCTPYVAAEHRDGVFIVPTLAHRKFFMRSNPKDSIALERAVDVLRRRGRWTQHSTIVDVGAHIGTTSIAALRRHGFERAVAIEPDPDNLRMLRANVALNDLYDHVFVIQGAVSRSAGRRQFLPGLRKGAAGRFLWMKGSLTDRPSPDTIAVETFTLDGLCEAGLVDPATTGLLWLDCQKQEAEALQSASAFFERRVPIVFVLRPRRLTQSSRLVAALGEAYEHVVDLRHGGVDDVWAPDLRPIEEIVSLSDRKRLTDVLVC